ncbi:MAG: hypothetical protein AAF360_02610 [Pseudomonadota bacterium]
MTSIDETDLRAAAESGALSEAQAAALTALARNRAGERSGAGPRERADGEPFTLFHGFNDVFVEFGIVTYGLGVAIAFALLGLGAIVIALGASWARLRRRLMRASPGFPGETSLPPYDTDAL